MILRDYQQAMTDKARDRLRAKVKRLLMVAPTGAGKTVKAAFMQGRAAQRGQISWFVVHRIEIILRTSETFTALGIDHGIVADGFPLQPEKRVQICSVDTLVGKLHLLPTPDGIVFDEAHHIVAGNHSRIADCAQDAWKVGITATPERIDGQGLEPFFDEMILGPTPRNLKDRGFLSPFKYFAPGQVDWVGDEAGLNRRNTAEFMQNSAVVGDAVDQWGKHAENMRTIGFEMSRKASLATVDAFRSSGIEAAHVDGVMHRDQRREIMTAFRDGEIMYLSQVAIAGEGVDIPGAECALLRYQTNSLTKFLQDCGRVFRPVYEPGFDQTAADDIARVMSIAAGPKPFAVVLDMGGNAFLHGMPDDDREWSLKGARERRRREKANQGNVVGVRHCPECLMISASTVNVCEGCGHEFAIKYRDPKVVAGELAELKRLEEQRKADLKQRQKQEEWACKTLDDWKRLAERRGYKPGWAIFRWKARAGRRAA